MVAPSASIPTHSRSPHASINSSAADLFANAADPSTTRSAPASRKASTCPRFVTPPLPWTGTPSAAIDARCSRFVGAPVVARSMSTTWSRVAPASTNRAAAATGLPPSAWIGSTSPPESRTSRPRAMSIAGMISNVTGEAYASANHEIRHRDDACIAARDDLHGLATEERAELRQQTGVRVDAVRPHVERRHAARRQEPYLYRRPAGVRTEQLAELRDDGVRATSRWHVHDEQMVGRGLPLDPEVRLADLERAELELASSEIGPPLHEHDGVGLDQLGNALVHIGEGHDDHAASEVLQAELRERLSLLRELPRHEPDDAGDGDDVAVPEPTDLRELHVGLCRQHILYIEERVIGHELPEHLLLQPKECSPVELVPDQDRFLNLRRRSIAAAEQRGLARRLRLALRGDGDRDLLVRLDQRPARVPEGVERARVDQALEHLPGEHGGVHLATEVGETRERALRAPGLDDLLHGPRSDVPNRGQAEPDPPSVTRRRREVLFGFVHVRRENLEAHQPAGIQVEGLAILVVFHAGEHGRHVLDWMMALQERGLIRDVCVGARVRGIEAVVGERLHEIEHLSCEPLRVSVRLASFDELLAVDEKLRADLLPHGLAKHVCLGHRVAGHTYGDLHDLLLVDHDPVRAREDLLEVGVRVRDGLPPVLALRVLDVHPRVQGTGPVQGDQRHQVLEPVRRELLDER